MEVVRFGIIGAGAAAQLHARAIRDNEGARLAAVADPAIERARSLAEAEGARSYSDYHDLLSSADVDVVTICTPTGLRGRICMEAADHGKHVVAEKPLDVTLEQADAAIEKCERSGVMLACILQNRFLDGPRMLKNAIQAGRLGRLLVGDAYIKWHRPQPYYDSADWRGTWEMDGGGALMNQGIHYIDLLQWMMGPVRSVFGRTATLAHERIEVEDTAVACLEFRSGALGVIEACTSACRGTPARLEIRGERGTVVIEDGIIVSWLVDGEEVVPTATNSGSGASDPMAVGTLGHKRQIGNMVEAVTLGRPPAVDGSEGRKAIEILAAIYKSSEQSRPVSLPLAGVTRSFSASCVQTFHRPNNG